MSTAKVKAIVFDAYGTLFNINSLDKILQENFGDQSVELSALWRKKQLEYTWLRTMMNRYKPFSEVTVDALTYSCNSLGLSFTTEIQDKLRVAYLRLEAYQEVRSILEVLTKKVSLAVLSNANTSMLTGAIKRNGFSKFFSHIISVEEISLFKPRREVYQLACTKFQLDAEQILFVSSNTWDVIGAKSYGLKVAWLNRVSGVLDELDFEPDFELEEMEQLLEVVNY